MGLQLVDLLESRSQILSKVLEKSAKLYGIGATFSRAGVFPKKVMRERTTLLKVPGDVIDLCNIKNE